jgi:hypothetical protein
MSSDFPKIFEIFSIFFVMFIFSKRFVQIAQTNLCEKYWNFSLLANFFLPSVFCMFCTNEWGKRGAVVFLYYLAYTFLMAIEQTVEVPINHRLIIDVPREIPAGRTIIAFTPAVKSVYNPQTVGEALIMAEEKAADPNRKPISRLFGKHKGLFGGDGVAYQRAIRDEWD